MPEKIYFKKAYRKQMGTLIFLLTVTIGSLFVLDLSKENDFYLWLLITLFSVIAGLTALRSQGKRVLCPRCQSDLFNTIQRLKRDKVSFHYCPHCGEELEV